MSPRHLLVPLCVVGTLLLAGTARAQQGVTEIGFDMALAYETESEIFSVSVPFGGTFGTLVGPQGGVRVGFFLSDALALEPTVSFQLVSESGGDFGDGETSTALGSAVKLVYHFRTDPAASRFFVAGGPTFTWVDLGDSSTQFGLAGELGVKLPIADRIGARLAAGYMHGFENDDFGSRNVIYGTAGLSVFLGGS
jgi:hypothetical protein